MRLHRVLCTVVTGTALLLAATACDPAGVGDPCTPEVRPPAGQAWAYGEVSVETRSLQCRTRTCMVYHFFPAGREPGEPDWRVCPNPEPLSSPPERVGERIPCAPKCGEPGEELCDPMCCNWPAKGSAQEPCRSIGFTMANFVRHFCKWHREGIGWVPEMDPPGDLNPYWYCNFDMNMVNTAKPFCTFKCGGAGRTFECPEGFHCEEVVRLGPEGMRGSYCVPNRLVDCDTSRAGDQDCCTPR